MRNLALSRVDEVSFETDNDGLPLCASAYDTATGDLIVAFGPTPTKPIIELRRHKITRSPEYSSTTTLITSWDAPCPIPDLPCDKVLSLRYIAETQSICLILAGGDLVLVREDPGPDDEKIEIVGSIDVGVAAASWSWNGAFLALVTREGNFVLMSQQLEPVNETALAEDDLKLSKHVNVGWGKKETQFQGKRAKAMKDPTMPDNVDEGRPSEFEDDITTISWRGDGAYVAVNSAMKSERRVIRVYSAEGVLDSVSEPVDGLESAISWRPYGNLIASIKRSADKLQVVFFERNGLRHGEFDLRLSQEEMSSIGKHISLAWNCDSSILAVIMTDRIQLWTMGNYHYYLKREIRLDQVESFVWHPSDPFRCLSLNGLQVQSVMLNSKFERASMVEPFDYGLVSVIDGRQLKLTPLKHVGTPPPMAFVDLQVEDNIIAHAISRTCQRIAIMTDEHMYLCQWQMRQASSKSDTALRHTNKINIEKLPLPISLHNVSQHAQLAMLDDDVLYVLVPARGSSEALASKLYKHTWTDTTQPKQTFDLTEIENGEVAQQLLVDANQQNLCIRTDTKILFYSGLDPDTDAATILQSVPATSTTHIASLPSAATETHCAFSLDESRQLLSNGELKANEVTSFALQIATSSTLHRITSSSSYTLQNHPVCPSHLIPRKLMSDVVRSSEAPGSSQ